MLKFTFAHAVRIHSGLLPVYGVNYNLSAIQHHFTVILHRFKLLLLCGKVNKAKTFRLSFGIFHERNLLTLDARDRLQLLL